MGKILGQFIKMINVKQIWTLSMALKGLCSFVKSTFTFGNNSLSNYL